MYNEEQKERYIQSYLSQTSSQNVEKFRRSMGNFFNRLEEVEMVYEKDFAMFNLVEIEFALSMIGRKGVKYQNTILSNLRKYMQWCINNGRSLDAENRLLCMKPCDIDFSLSYRYCMMPNEEQLQNYLDVVMREVEADSVDNMYRALCHLIFSGLTFNEVLQLKNSELDLQNGKIQLKNKTIMLSQRCSKLLRYYKSMTHYMSSIGESRERKTEIIEKGFVLERTVATRSSMKASLTVALSQKLNGVKDAEYKIATTPNDIFVSGIFYRMYQQEKNNEQINYDEYASRYQDRDKAMYSPNSIISTCKLEYNYWKKAFEL